MAAWLRVRDGGHVQLRGNQDGRSMEMFHPETLVQLTVLAEEEARSRGLLVARDEADASRARWRRVIEYSGGDGCDEMRHELDVARGEDYTLRLQNAGVYARVHRPRHHRPSEDG